MLVFGPLTMPKIRIAELLGRIATRAYAFAMGRVPHCFTLRKKD